MTRGKRSAEKAQAEQIRARARHKQTMDFNARRPHRYDLGKRWYGRSDRPNDHSGPGLAGRQLVGDRVWGRRLDRLYPLLPVQSLGEAKTGLSRA